MKDLHNLPLVHTRIKKIRKLLTNEKIKQSLNRFVYRYRIARAFKGISAPEIGKKTIEGYATGMRLMLAYSAFEEISNARRALPNIRLARGDYVKIHNKTLAIELSGNKNLELLLLDNHAIYDEKLKSQIKQLFVGENDNVMCLATGLRNTFAHGVFTAAGAGLDNKQNRKFVEELIEELLGEADLIALQCVVELEEQMGK